jgi:hypothetical protein
MNEYMRLSFTPLSLPSNFRLRNLIERGKGIESIKKYASIIYPFLLPSRILLLRRSRGMAVYKIMYTNRMSELDIPVVLEILEIR